MQQSEAAISEPPTSQPVMEKFRESLPHIWRQTYLRTRSIAFGQFQMSNA